MESTRFLKITIIVLLLVNIATLIFMWSGRPHKEGHLPPPPHGGGPRAAFEFLNRELQLTTEQQTKLEDMSAGHRKEARALDDISRPLHHRFFDLLGKPDSARMQQLADSLGWWQKERELMTYRHFAEIRTICTPEQQKKFDEVINEALRMMAPKGSGGPPPGR